MKRKLAAAAAGVALAAAALVATPAAANAATCYGGMTAGQYYAARCTNSARTTAWIACHVGPWIESYDGNTVGPNQTSIARCPALPWIWPAGYGGWHN